MYFECNLEEHALSGFEPSLADRYAATVRSIKARTDKLNAAMQQTSLDGATFSHLAKIVFTNCQDRFDAMQADELARVVTALDDGKRYEQRMEWPNAVVLFDCDFVLVKEWELLRHIGIGGSDSAVVMGVSPYRSKRQLYFDKRGVEAKGAVDEGKAAIFARGHFMEDYVIDAFCKTCGAKRIPESRMFRSKKYPHCTANIDAIVQMPDGTLQVFEAKTTIGENLFAWTAGKIPVQYTTQMSQYPAVLDDERIKGTYIGCLFTKDYSVADIYIGSAYDESDFKCRYLERDIAYEENLLQAEEDFWQTHIIGDVMPDASGDTSEDVRELAEMYGTDENAAPMQFDLSSCEDMIKQWDELNKRKSEFEKKAEEIKNERDKIGLKFVEALQGTPIGEAKIDDDTYYELRFKGSKKTSCDLKLLEQFYPEAYDACVTFGTRTPVFSIKKKAYKKKK